MKAAQLRYADIHVMKAWSLQDDWQDHFPSTAATLDARVDDATVKNIASHWLLGWFLPL